MRELMCSQINLWLLKSIHPTKICLKQNVIPLLFIPLLTCKMRWYICLLILLKCLQDYFITLKGRVFQVVKN